MKFRTRFDSPLKIGVACTEAERRTKSEFVDECDINKLIARYVKTGRLPDNAKSAAARFGDFSQVPTFGEMQEKILAANDLFMELPSAVRKQFDNDPGQFLAAADTKEGRVILQALGLGAESTDLNPLGGAGSASSSPDGQSEGAGTEPAPEASKASPSTKKVK